MPVLPMDVLYAIFDPRYLTLIEALQLAIESLGGAVDLATEVTAEYQAQNSDVVVFATTANGADSYLVTLPVLATAPTYKRITIIHTAGSSGLVTVPAGDGLAVQELAPGQGITVMKRATAWEIIGRI